MAHSAMNAAVVVDASLAVMWATPEEHTEKALTMAAQWAETGVHLIAPCLLVAEVTNALYRRTLRGELNLATAQAALDIVLAFSIELHEEPGLPARAMALASELRQPTTYDCHYLALAEKYRCELWTGDRRFFHAVRRSVLSVRWIGEGPHRASRLRPSVPEEQS